MQRIPGGKALIRTGKFVVLLYVIGLGERANPQRGMLMTLVNANPYDEIPQVVPPQVSLP
ncbi:hypothetical protein ACFQUU_01210 [Herbaspirillum sp. GCM10030257]|uniref:hypothetical protein n=1 Tax=Herbaspirillum sp. GCM10030257 TaxID=3273393 RepID=UPI00361BDEBF